MEKAGAMGLVLKGNGVQAIYGPKADVLKSDIQDLLDSGTVIPIVDLETGQPVAAAQVTTYKGITEEIVSVANGQVEALDVVKDPVFSQK